MNFKSGPTSIPRDYYYTDGTERTTNKTWNNKTVYRKGYTGTAPSNTTPVTFGAIPSGVTIIQVFGTIARTDGLGINPISFDSDSVEVTVTPNGTVSLHVINSVFFGKTYSILIEYVK